MKLRIKGNSLRLRVSRSELDLVSNGQRVQETIYFGPESDASLTYALEWDEVIAQTTVKYESHTVTVQIPSNLARNWGTSDLVGLSGHIDLGSVGILEVLVEKDFACFDRSDATDEDTFPNPNVAVVC
jgi:hypothetical protein